MPCSFYLCAGSEHRILEQEKIDVTRATPVSKADSASAKPQRGAPLWLQLLLSLVVIVIALGIAALFNPTANTMVKRLGLTLPMLTGDAGSAPQAQAATQGGKQGAGQAQAQGQGGGRGRQGGAGGYGSRSAVVVVVPVASAVINNKLTAIGNSSAMHSVTVNTAQSGTLMSVMVKPGDRVTAGEKIATLDTDSQQIAYDKANLAVQDAQATLTRTQQLAKTAAASDVQVATAQLAFNNAQLALNEAKVALDQRTIISPIDGVVGLIQVTPGNLVNAQTVVTTIEDSSEIRIDFWVPERYSSQVVPGMPVKATSAALPSKTFDGTVTAVDNKIDPDSRTLQIQATLPNPDGMIKAGMSFSIDMGFPGETFTSVDPLSIQWSTDGAYVWKVVDNKAQMAKITIIQRNSDGVLVQGDVKIGDPVVTQGVLQLSQGMTVRLLDTGTQQAAANGGTPGQGQGDQTQGGQGGTDGTGAQTGQATGGTHGKGGGQKSSGSPGAAPGLQQTQTAAPAAGG